MKEIPETAIVVGASSGIGAACVHELARRGWRVAALARRREQLEEVCRRATSAGPGRAIPVEHDVTAYGHVPELLREILEELGGLGMLLYAAGVMPQITPETWDFAADRQMIETNLIGCAAWIDGAAPCLREQEGGSIVGISSVAGDRGRRRNPAYHASKAGMDAFLESVRNRLHRYGVRVTTIKPGFIDTAMVQGMEGLFWVVSPEAAARQIVGAALKGRQVRYVPRRWRPVGLLVRSIPSFIFRRLDI